MKRLIQLAALACLAQSGAALAEQPLDFSYRITGEGKQRPLLVFNDGIDVFVQPNPEGPSDVRIVGAAAERQGPYFVIRGLPDKFSLEGKKGTGRSEISYEGRPQVQVRPVAQTVTVAPSPVAPPVAAPVVTITAPKKTVVPSDACVSEQQTRESAFMLTFKGNASDLSPLIVEQLTQVIGDVSAINIVRIVPDASSAKLASERGAAIKRHLVKQGVWAEKVEIENARGSGIGTEIKISHSYTIPCKKAGISVAYKSPASVTLVGKAEVNVFLEQLTAAAGMKLRTEGVAISAPISLSSVNQPLVDALSEIGAQLGDKADVILRNKEILLRYRPPGYQATK